jgi:uncharacterized protein YaeQ
VALTATIYNFDIDLADADRGVYETLSLRVACHPSESEDFLLTRVLAYAAEYAEGIQFSRGLSEPDEPAISIRDLTGVTRAWIEVGTPDAARLHKAAKAAPRVAVYLHKEPAQFLARLSGEKIHRGEALEIWSLDRAFLAALGARLERRMAFALSISEREYYDSIGNETLSGKLTRHVLT